MRREEERAEDWEERGEGVKREEVQEERRKGQENISGERSRREEWKERRGRSEKRSDQFEIKF